MVLTLLWKTTPMKVAMSACKLGTPLAWETSREERGTMLIGWLGGHF